MEKVRKIRKNIVKKRVLPGVFLAVFVIIIAVLCYFYFQDKNQFNFAGLKWKIIEDENGTKYYYSRFRIMEGFPVYTALFENDPRTESVEIEQGTFFKFNQKTFITFNADAEECGAKNAVVTQMLSEFLSTAGIETERATADKNLSEESGMPFKNCITAKNSNYSVIMLEKSDYPYIWQPNKNCYVIRVGNCENLKAGEKFITAIIVQLHDIEEIMTGISK